MRKKIFILILSVIIIVFSCVIYSIYFLKPFLEEKILDIAEKTLGRDLEISELDLGLLQGIVFLKGFKIENSSLIRYQNAINADEIILDVDLIATIFKRKPVFQRISLKNFTFNLGKIEQSKPAASTASPISEGSKATQTLLKQKKPFSDFYIKHILIENSKFAFTDYSAKPSPTIIEIVDINGSIEGLSIPLSRDSALKGIAHLKGQLSSKNEGSIRIDGPFAKGEGKTDFDFKIDLVNVNLIRFEPYYSNTSFAILKDARLTLHSEARCQQNRLNAFQDARIYNIVLHDIHFSSEDTLFGLPAGTVIDFFKELKSDIRFSFNITGTIYDPQFYPGPVIRQVLLNAMRDRIIAKLQELPQKVIKAGEKAIDKGLEVGGEMKILDKDEIEAKLKGIEKKFKKIIGYESQ